uniref:HdeA/HdeB family chaperone n=1 Tax=uncultured Altererythrobacter sp. TaxID=500840 RepID=UPI00262F7C70|nr:HdeA/HdeB family chaperone [uncultured Altererythrobacter sp.]
MKTTKIIGMGTVLAALAFAPLAANDAKEQQTPQVEDTYNFGLESGEPFDLSAISCWDIVTLSEDDRAFAMVLLFGYAQGEAGQSVVSPQEIQVAVVNTMMECVDKPDDNAIDVLRTHMKVH